MPPSAARMNSERDFERRNFGNTVLRDMLSLVSGVAGSTKHLGAQKIHAVAEATRTFGEDLDDIPQLREYADSAAAGLDELGDYIERTEIPDILDDAIDYAKRQPMMTAALAIAAGIVITQVMRNWRMTQSSGEGRQRRRGGRGGAARRMH